MPREQGRGPAKSIRERILIVDDDRTLRQQLAISLKKDYEISEAGNRSEALAAVAQQSPDLLLLDLHMPPGKGTEEGMKVLRRVRKQEPDAMVIVMTADESKESALRTIEEGAYDFFRKPIPLTELKLIIRRALEKQRIERENRQLREKIVQQSSFHKIIGKSEAMKRVFDSIRRAADGTTTVILRGESGTGKELVARAIHEAGNLPGPFIAVQGSALPEHLIESELFGHEKGAFTDAICARPGRFELADGGTLFLDEIGTLSLPLQAKLLRVLEERQFIRLGGKKSLRVNLQLITATNEDLEKRIREGTFREDLYYRINVYPIYLPPLRERQEDIPPLVEHFLLNLCRARGIPPKRMEESAMQRLVNYEWRGNVRELENVVQNIVLRTDGTTIADANLPEAILEFSPEKAKTIHEVANGKIDLAGAVERYELQLLQMALTRSGGVKIEAARRLGIDKNRMMYLCRKHGLGGSERQEG